LLPVVIYANNLLMAKITHYLSKDISQIDYSIFSVNMFKSLTIHRLFFMVIFISLFVYLSININDFILKMNNLGSSSSGNVSGHFGPGGNNVNPGGPRGNPGPVGNVGINTSSVDSGFGVNADENPGSRPVDNTAPNLDRIKAKVEWRANNIVHRPVPIFSKVYDNNFDCNFTRDEIVFLSQKIREHGLENSKPFTVLTWKKGEFEGLDRVVRLKKGAINPTTTNTLPVLPSKEFKIFLNSLI